MSVPFVGWEAEPQLNWLDLAKALEAGHQGPKAEVADTLLTRSPDALLSRAAWISGLGALVKTATVFPGNTAQGLPTIGGAVSLFDDETGALKAMLDFALVTKWKTAGDSLCAALKLARPESENILLVGAGTVAQSLRQAYASAFPKARFAVWARDIEKAQAFAKAHDCTAKPNLEAAVKEADIIASATMTIDPILKGDWLQPGQHVDLIGAYRPDMREADDTALSRADVYVDSRSTTIGHIGEIDRALASGAITTDDIIADYYEPAQFHRKSPNAITLFKNGGGAHLDLMTAHYILSALK